MTQRIHPIVEAVRPHVTPIKDHQIVIDFERSEGGRLYDLNSDIFKLDFASSFASVPLGYNHPRLKEQDFEKELLLVGRTKISNLNILSESYQKFLETFRRVMGVPGFDRFYFVDGGALAVENALKTAFDWKIRRNLRADKGERGTEVIHFRQAFHGRSGYTLSLTNTDDPNKTKFFPKFQWPRILNPKCRFPMDGQNLEACLEDERAAMNEIEKVMKEKADDIACILIETIQGEGGDNHFRTEFFEFLRKTADKHDCLLIYDEVQTGIGATGKKWAWMHHDVQPDMICFAKKAQVGGFMAGPRVMEEEMNVFKVPSRITTTWGSSLVDMVRSRRILEVIEEQNLIENAAERGEQILKGLDEIERETELIQNVRGKGLFAAFDLVIPETRTDIQSHMSDNGLLSLICGDRSMRFRPHLNVSSEEIDEALEITRKALKSVPLPAGNPV